MRVGVGLWNSRPAYFVTRRNSPENPSAARVRPIESHRDFLVLHSECEEDARPVSAVPGQGRHRPLACGLEIQNLDQGIRDGLDESAFPNVGTLGCFVRLGDGSVALLSNNHVIAGENDGLKGRDRIVQPGGPPSGGPAVATLADFVTLASSRPGTAFASNGKAPNIVDAAIATVDVGWQQAYLAGRSTQPPVCVATALPGDLVSKVGRTTGETHGFVTRIGVTVGPIRYKIGPCWFRRTIIIETDDGRPFGNVGDSGAVVVRGAREVVGLLYGGLPGLRGRRKHGTYACQMTEVLKLLKCSLP